MGKRIMRVLLSKTVLFALLALLQIAFFVVLVHMFANVGAIAYNFLMVVTVLVLVAILEQDDLNPAYKLMWTLIIVLMPLSGTLFYLLWGHRHVPRRQQRKFDEIEKRSSEAITQDEALFPQMKFYSRRLYHTAQYLLNYAAAPVYAGTDVEYYAVGEDFFPPFVEALKSAKQYIFMEYFIVQEGYMWNTVLDILRQKAAEGVDVRVIYDGFGSLFTLPVNYEKKLRGYGIKCHIFSPLTFSPHISDYAMLNHRDHRKITVVDGEIGFSGGLNMADEYIDRESRFGYWKDTAFKLEGEAVYSLTVTFLKAWDFVAKEQSNFEEYRPAKRNYALPSPGDIREHGLVQPYCDTPLDGENVSENAYLRTISCARDYVYISTPYLILDNEMITTLTLAAKSGLDVRLLTPGIPDKKLVYVLTQSYYATLLRAGVKIYEYTPGFNHAKMYVCDDKVAIVGSANMDYRSLYLHFENCSIFYGGSIVPNAKQDMLNSFEVSHPVTLEEAMNVPLHKRLLRTVIRFLAPIL